MSDQVETKAFGTYACPRSWTPSRCQDEPRDSLRATCKTGYLRPSEENRHGKRKDDLDRSAGSTSADRCGPARNRDANGDGKRM